MRLFLHFFSLSHNFSDKVFEGQQKNGKKPKETAQRNNLNNRGRRNGENECIGKFIAECRYNKPSLE